MQYWFRPKKFWKVFAFYYPSSVQGLVVTLILAVFAAVSFWIIRTYSASVRESLYGYALWFIAFGVVFDCACFRFGEYPSWWRKR